MSRGDDSDSTNLSNKHLGYQQYAVVQESQIRKMTRLAVQYGAINLSQGFPDEGPPFEGVSAIVCGLLGGTDENQKDIGNRKVTDILNNQVLPSSQHQPNLGLSPQKPQDTTVSQFLRALHLEYSSSAHYISQYSTPFGRPLLREKIAVYYEKFYPDRQGGTRRYVDPDKNITVTLGATEALAVVLRTVCRPGDYVLIIEPYHELYPSQASVFYLETEYTELREEVSGKSWRLDFEDVEAKAKRCKVLILCDPHNPTGKVFEIEELQKICKICLKHNTILVADDIYEHIIFTGAECQKHLLAGWDTESILTQAAGFNQSDIDRIANLYIVMNSVSKTWSCTGWRLGWVISPAHITEKIRAVHDQMVLQAATPIQLGCEALLDIPTEFYLRLRHKYQERRDYLIPELRKLGFECCMPNSAYYAFVRFRNVPALKGKTAADAAMFILKKVGVASVPGYNFYHGGHNHEYIRFCFCRKLLDLNAAIERMQTLKIASDLTNNP